MGRITINRTSILGVIARKVVGKKYGRDLKKVLSKDNSIIIAENNKRYNTSWKVPKGYILEEIKLKNLSMEFLYKESKSNKIILNIHGGGYIYGMDNAYRDLSYHYSKITDGLSVVTPNYRVASIGPYPYAFHDCIEAYKWILNQGYEGKDIIIVGDSAGGALALSLVQYVIDKKIQVPCAIVTWSAWANLACDSNSYKVNQSKDTLFGEILKGGYDYRSFPYVKDNDIKDKYMCPIYCDYKNFPDMLMQVGSYEVVFDDTNIIAEKARKNGVNVINTSYHGMFHVFQFAYNMIPESKKAWQEIEGFLREHI